MGGVLPSCARHALAVAAPGPDFAALLKQSLVRGRRAAIWTSIGIGTAILLHVSYSLLGLGLLIRNSAVWFNIVKSAGAVYIAWVGIQALRARPRDPAEIALADQQSRKTLHGGGGAFALGFLTNALNPKATLFFISLFAIVISPSTPRFVQAAYGLWMSAATMAWFSFVAVVFTHSNIREKFLRHGHWIERALGVVFIGFALSLAFTTFK
jgi:RhtB (resistance to homoserine/threonine) family protein